jgi:hypothetical protein
MTEPQLSSYLRRGRVKPPPLVGDRRLWTATDVIRAGTALGMEDREIRRRLLRRVSVEGGPHVD